MAVQAVVAPETALLKQRRNATLDALLFENGRADKIRAVLEEQHAHIIDAPGGVANILASRNYPWYRHTWFRDSCKGALHLIEFAAFVEKWNLEDSFKNGMIYIHNDLPKIIRTMWQALDFFYSEDKPAEAADITKLESRRGRNHVLARFDVTSSNGSVSLADPDINQPSELRSWIMQYDATPLVMSATKNYLERYGSEKINDVVPLIKKLLPNLASYMQNFHTTPCADAWEQYYFYGTENVADSKKTIGKTIDSYSVAAVYHGVKSARRISTLLDVEMPPNINESEIEQFLATYFVMPPENGKKTILNKSKIEYGDTIGSIDSAAVEVMRLFNPSTAIDSEVAENTLKCIEEELLGKNVLPIRYRFFGKYSHIKDTYFYGGRWFPNGLELAMLYTQRSEFSKAKTIIEYVEHRINPDGSVPEQEIIDPSSPDDDPQRYLEKNGGSPITCLWWSETAYLGAVGSYLDKMASSTMQSQ